MQKMIRDKNCFFLCVGEGRRNLMNKKGYPLCEAEAYKGTASFQTFPGICLFASTSSLHPTHTHSLSLSYSI